jgi:hypothetical protein
MEVINRKSTGSCLEYFGLHDSPHMLHFRSGTRLRVIPADGRQMSCPLRDRSIPHCLHHIITSLLSSYSYVYVNCRLASFEQKRVKGFLSHESERCPFIILCSASVYVNDPVFRLRFCIGVRPVVQI